MRSMINMVGFKTEYLTVVKYVGKNYENRSLWECICKCGNLTYATGKSLRNGEKVSCGCKRFKVLSNQGKLNKTHGDTNTRLYSIWVSIRKRCNPKYKHLSKYKFYSGKGIKVCSLWDNSYEEFKQWAIENGYTDNLTIDRIDSSKHYCPENCRWVTMKDQQNNRSNTIYIKYNNEYVPRGVLADRLGITIQALGYRSRYGSDKDSYKEYVLVNGKFEEYLR